MRHGESMTDIKISVCIAIFQDRIKINMCADSQENTTKMEAKKIINKEFRFKQLKSVTFS